MVATTLLFMQITGKTKVLAVIGNPISHTASPKMQNAMIRSLNLDYVYIPILSDEAHLETTISSLRANHFSGANVTVPFKEKVLPFLDKLSPEAERIGAVNTIVNQNGELWGTNTDGDGFILSLKEELNFDPKHKTIAIIGAGGAAKAIADALIQKEPNALHLFNRTPEKLHSLVNTLEKFGDTPIQAHKLTETPILETADLVIQTTPIGMKNDECPIEMNWVNANQLVYDIIYAPPETRFLKKARLNGAKTCNGLGMLAGQGCLAFYHFTGHTAPFSRMKTFLS